MWEFSTNLGYRSALASIKESSSDLGGDCLPAVTGPFGRTLNPITVNIVLSPPSMSACQALKCGAATRFTRHSESLHHH